MLNFTIRRIILVVLVALTVSVIAFFLVRMSGDLATALAGEDANAQEIADIRKIYGLDRPLIFQYADWLFNALRGDFGASLYFPETVGELVAMRLPTTLLLAFSGLLRWTPISGDETWQHFILPAFTLGYYSTPPIMRLTRSGMLEVLSADYIRTAYAKGLQPLRVLFKHALRNAVIPVVALASVQFGHMLSGAIVIESVFAMQGIGYLAWESILRNDIAVIQAILLIVCLFYVGLTFISDLLNAWLDPRIRVS